MFAYQTAAGLIRTPWRQFYKNGKSAFFRYIKIGDDEKKRQNERKT